MGALGPGRAERTGKVQGLAQLFDSYGEEILWDFNAIGIDIHDYMTGDRGWVEFYAFLSQLDSHTKFRSAISQDPELARAQVDSLTDDDIRKMVGEEDEETEPAHLTPEGHTMEIEKLNQILDSLQILRLTMSMSDKKPKFKPVARPKTEQQALIEKRAEQIRLSDQDSFEKAIGF